MKRIIVLLVCSFLLASCNLGGVEGASSAIMPSPTPESITETATNISEATATTVTPSNSACPSPIMEAINTLKIVCQSTQRNQVCYGNPLIQAQFSAPVNFAKTGDTAPFTQLQTIELLSDIANNAYGIVLMRLQANIPDTLPGQNVTFLLFGEGELSNGGANGLYFRGGIGEPVCNDLPHDGLLVQTPSGAANVTFLLNGVEVSLGSTAYFENVNANTLRVNVIEGNAILSVQGESQAVPAGMRSDVTLDNSGIAISAPTIAQPYDIAPLRPLPLNALERTIETAPPGRANGTTEGSVRLLDETGRQAQMSFAAYAPNTTTYIKGELGNSLSLPDGAYDIRIETRPVTTVPVRVVGGETITLTMPPSGGIALVDAQGNLSDFVAGIYLPNTTTYVTGVTNGEMNILEGTYDIHIETRPVTILAIKVARNEVTTIRMPTVGRLAFIDANKRPISNIITLYEAGTTRHVDSTSIGVFDNLLEGTYDAWITQDDGTDDIRPVRVIGGQTNTIQIIEDATPTPSRNARATATPMTIRPFTNSFSPAFIPTATPGR